MLPRRFYFDNALDDLFEEEGARMKCDIYEKDNTYHVDMDLPGFKKEEIKVECNKGNLIVSAEKKHEEEEKDEKKKYLRRERKFYGKYQRSFYVGGIDQDNIQANFENGILKISMPKKEEEKSSKKTIEIK